MWHYTLDGETFGPVPESDIAVRLRSGQLGPASFVWRQGMADWQPIHKTELHAYVPVGDEASDVVLANPDAKLMPQYKPGYQEMAYRPANVLTLVCTVALFVDMLACLASVFVTYLEVGLLKAAQNGYYDEDAFIQSDIQVGLVALLSLTVLIVNAVVFSMWIYRANKNARALGGEEWMTFSAGWSVGWFFIPIANFWKPFQAMREIYNASYDTTSSSEQNHLVVTIWWFFWIVACVIGNISSRLITNAEEIDELIRADSASIGADITRIFAAMAAIVMIRATYKLQQCTAEAKEMA